MLDTVLKPMVEIYKIVRKQYWFYQFNKLRFRKIKTCSVNVVKLMSNG